MRYRIVTGALIAGLALSGCVSAESEQSSQGAEPDPTVVCTLTSPQELALLFDSQFYEANVVPSDDETVKCRWAASDSLVPAFVSTEVRSGGRQAFEQARTEQQKEAGVVTVTKVKGAQRAFLVPLTKTIGMQVGDTYAQITLGIGGASAGDLERMAEKAASRAAG
ncbi:MAG: hypothetical protein KDC39_03435 [Actinobacteria bacterium]|nr:hypothetical protein [Actinomycetota bacterium]